MGIGLGQRHIPDIFQFAFGSVSGGILISYSGIQMYTVCNLRFETKLEWFKHKHVRACISQACKMFCVILNIVFGILVVPMGILSIPIVY